MCGVQRIFGCRHNGLLAGSGSVANTSSAAPARWPVSTAATRSSSRSTAPRETLMTNASRGSAANAGAARRPAVAVVSGSAQTRMALRARNGASSALPANVSTLVDATRGAGPDGDRKSEAREDLRDRRADRAVAHHADRAAALVLRQEPLPLGARVLRLESRQLAMEPQRHQRDVLRHPLSLQRIDGADDGQMRRNVRRGEEVVDAGSGAGDELERRKSRRDARGELEGEQRLDVSGRGSAGIGVNTLLRRELLPAPRAAARRTGTC